MNGLGPNPEPTPPHGPDDPDPAPGYCRVCGEDDPSVLIACRDQIVRCADHALKAGCCWGCGDGDPQWYAGEDDSGGLCHDCRSADVMFERNRQRRRIFRS